MKCAVLDCDNPRKKGRTLCSKHAARQDRHGDLNVVLKSGVKPAILDYRTVHEHLVKKRGRASDFSCVRCLKPAREWALNHSSSEIVTDDQGRLLSFNLQDYMPMCQSCHYHYDREAGQR